MRRRKKRIKIGKVTKNTRLGSNKQELLFDKDNSWVEDEPQIHKGPRQANNKLEIIDEIFEEMTHKVCADYRSFSYRFPSQNSQSF